MLKYLSIILVYINNCYIYLYFVKVCLSSLLKFCQRSSKGSKAFLKMHELNPLLTFLFEETTDTSKPKESGSFHDIGHTWPCDKVVVIVMKFRKKLN